MARVLVTGAFGNVGRAVASALLADGHHVVATDLASKPARRVAARLVHPRLEVRWGDLTAPGAATDLVAGQFDAVVHLAGVIPPVAYARPELARRVNVDATAALVEVIAGSVSRPRLVFASSMAVFGSRNPHTVRELAGGAPPRPTDLYGRHKVACEELIRASGIDAAILRLGAVVSPDLVTGMDLDTVFLEGALPNDGRVHVVDIRDTARAFVAAVDADCAGTTLHIGGDATTRLTQGALSARMTEAIGLPGLLPVGLPGNPADDDAWFTVDWMDTDEAQRLLDFQHHGFDAILEAAQASLGWKGRLVPVAAPVVRPLGRAVLGRRSPYHGRTDGYADPWGVLTTRWGAHVTGT